MKDGWPRGRRMLQTWLLTSEEMASLLLRELVLLYRGEFHMCDCNTKIWIISNIKIENQQAEGRTGMGVRGRAPSEGQRVKKKHRTQRLDTSTSRMTKPDVLILICMFSNQNEGSGHLSRRVYHGNRLLFQMFLEGSPRFITCLFLV